MTELMQETPLAAKSIPVGEVSQAGRWSRRAATTPVPIHRLSPEQALWPRYVEALFKSKYFILASLSVPCCWLGW